jgi:hypothetical protein
MSNVILSGKGNRTSLVAEATELAAKIESELPGAVFMVKGVKLTLAQAKAKLLAYVTAVQSTNGGRATVHDLVGAESDALDDMRDVTRAIQSFIISNYGDDATQLGALNLGAKTPAAKTVAVKAEAIAKGKATREVRHTLGPRQKAALHGTAPTPPAPAPTPSGTSPDKPGSNGR